MNDLINNVFSVGFPPANISLSPSLSWQIADSAGIGKCKRTGMMAFHTFGLRYRHAACVRLRREQSLHRPCVAQSNPQQQCVGYSGANHMGLFVDLFVDLFGGYFMVLTCDVHLNALRKTPLFFEFSLCLS
jgi:hypothetical protein